jgi:putative protease
VRGFKENPKVIPWFPAVIIGEEFEAAVQFLDKVQVTLLVTNNTGIAQEANQRGIAWIAGPQLNIVNSFSVLSLKENCRCTGAFISNELSRTQIKRIKKPAGFRFYYSIYHPIILMTSRQCLFHQVSGCYKHRVDESCIERCEKKATITSIKGKTFQIEKSQGNYHTVYNEINFLNTDIVTDIPGHFSGYCIDLRRIQTRTSISMDTVALVSLFEKSIQGNLEATEELNQAISPSTKTQYQKGI